MTKRYTCEQHGWNADYQCPDCHSAEDDHALQLDMTAIGCVNVALELARTDEAEPLCCKLIARYAYELAAAMLAERDKRRPSGPEARLLAFKEYG